MNPSTPASHATTRPSDAHRLAFFATVVGVLLSLALFRHGRLLTFDGYHYCELAKQFAETLPDRFGNHWPFGYPLAGSLLIRIGVPGYLALTTVSLVTLYFWSFLTARLLVGHPCRTWIVVALASAPIVGVEFLGILTELPFSLALLGLASSLSRWPARRALWSSAFWAVAALGIRYAGVLALAALATWLLTQTRALRLVGRWREAVLATVLAFAVSGGFLALNVAKSGHASGASRGVPLGLAALPPGMIDFGWSAPSALLAGGILKHALPISGLYEAIGGFIFLFLAALCVTAWFRPRSPASRPLALVALGYCTGMCVFHCMAEFDALYNARTFLPALAPLALLMAERFPKKHFIIFLLCATLTSAGLLAAGRGISREIDGDTRPAAIVLHDVIKPTDIIALNDHAFGLSAYLPQRTRRAWLLNGNLPSEERFLVVSGEPQNRSGDTAPVDKSWRDAMDQAVAAGRCRYLLNEPTLVVLEYLDR